MDDNGDICVNDISGNWFFDSLNLDLDFILVSLVFFKIISVIFSIIICFLKKDFCLRYYISNLFFNIKLRNK